MGSDAYRRSWRHHVSPGSADDAQSQARQPAREEDDDGGENGAQHEAPILGVGLQLVLQQRERECADDGAEEAGEAAQHGHEHEVARVRPVDELRVGKAGAKAQNGAADGAIDGGDGERREPELAHAHAEILGLLRVVAQRAQVQPERRVHDAPHDERGDHQQPQAVVVEGPGEELDLVVGGKLEPEDAHARDAHAAVAAGQMVELEQHGVRQHAEGEREHAEEDAGVAHAQEADRQRDDQPSQRDADQHDLELRDAEHAGDHGRAIGAEPEKHGMAEGQQAGVAKQQIEPKQGDGVAEERHQQVGVVGRGQDRHHAERRDGGGKRREAPGPRIMPLVSRTGPTA